MAIKRKLQKKDEDTLLDLTQAKSKASHFFEENQTIILGALVGLLVLIGGWFGYTNLVQGPKEEKAMAQMWKAQQQFEQDSLLASLENPGGGYSGFLEIINQYGGTKAGNMARYYAGIAYLNLGQFDDALKHLEAYKAKGSMGPALKAGALGDVYSEKNEMDKAISQYQKAVKADGNEFLTPYYMKKLALLYEAQGQVDKALPLYKEIKSDYPNSNEALSIDKYIARAEGK